MSEKRSNFLAYCKSGIAAFLLLSVVACGGGEPEEDEGLIGTGIIRGTVSESKVLVAERVDIKASTGEISSSSLNANSRFSETTIAGDEPYLLRTNLGNNEYRYALAYKNIPANVHSYSDVVIRSWFAVNGGNIDNEFDTENPIVNFPTQQEYNELSSGIFDVIGSIFSEYGVTGEQLLSSDYNANDRGVDEFLDSNPVVISGQDISVLQTDPVSDIQSRTNYGFKLNTPPAGNDTQSPTPPGGVRAFGGGADQIVVVWDQSIDNVGVVGYQVHRNGTLVGTTPFPVFTDTGLQPNSIHDYQIRAFDAADRLSEFSATATSRTLAADSNQPPPAPTNLEFTSVSANRIALRWNTNVSEVFAFRIYRGANGETPQPYIRAISNNIIDPSVSGGIEYCYEVAAIAADGVTESASIGDCVVTDGSVVTQTSSSTTTGTVSDTNIEAGNLVIPADTDSMACNNELPASPIVEDLLLTESCYRVTQTTSIAGFANVVIQPGTVLKFAQGTGLEINSTASLFANGTLQDPVIFTGMEQGVRGYWTGIHYIEAQKPDNRILNSVIEYAGGGSDNAALKVSSRDGDGFRTRLQVEGSVIRFNGGNGVSIAGAGARIVFTGNIVSENDETAHFSPMVLASISSDNDFTGNEREDSSITVGRFPISSDLRIPDLGVPLKSNGLPVTQANLTIDAGVEMRFLESASIQIEDGDLFINGTEDNPVIMTGLEREPGYWGGIHLTNSTLSNLKNVTIEYGGAVIGALFNANLGLVNSSVTVSNVTLSDSSSFGLGRDDQSTVSGTPLLIDNGQ